jgi:N-acetylglucosamine-6-sulfatase
MRLPARLSRVQPLWLVTVLVVLLAVAAILPLTALNNTTAPAPTVPKGNGASPTRPNIVYVLTDDLSSNLVRYMPHVLALEQRGMTFTNFTVTDSLCCPSRSTIFTGDFPHNTHVITNDPPDGGFDRFTAEGDDRSTFATSLSGVGYRTALIGKYLNHYIPEQPYIGPTGTFEAPYVPPGWSYWNGVDGGGYAEYGYTMAADHSYNYLGHEPGDYLTTIAQRRALGFMQQSTRERRPFLLEVATFAPHEPAVPAPEDIDTFEGLKAPRNPAFGQLPKNAPPWLAGHKRLTPAAIATIDHDFERRVESVQAVDRMIGALERKLTQLGQMGNTIFVFNSDNGYHLGQYNLHGGKMTAFDTDVRVPLVVAGPGITPGSVNSNVVENIDLRPTFDQLAGAPTPADVDGRSMVPLLHGAHMPWRNVALIEHHRPHRNPNDPDSQSFLAANPPSYKALRTRTFTYVHYVDGSHEFYDRAKDPNELDNIYASLSAQRKAALEAELQRMAHCHGAAQCWGAAQVGAG